MTTESYTVQVRTEFSGVVTGLVFPMITYENNQRESMPESTKFGFVKVHKVNLRVNKNLI